MQKIRSGTFAALLLGSINSPLPVDIAAIRETALQDNMAWDFTEDLTTENDLQQDGARYFDIHHIADDIFDKVDRAQLQQNVSAWTVTLFRDRQCFRIAGS